MGFAKMISPVDDVAALPWIVVAIVFMLYVLVRAIILQGGIYLFVTRTALATRNRVYRIPFGKGQFRSELRATVWNIVVDGAFIATLVHFLPPNKHVHNLVTAFVLSFIWLEIWFYVSHRLMHLPQFYFIHKQHHVATVVSPFTALSFSVLERMILLTGGVGGIALFSAFVLPLAPFGVAMYLVFNYLMNLFAHLNVEVVPPWMLKTPVGRFFNAPAYHSLHHARYRGHYGLYTPYMDWIFNSQFTDYREVQKRAFAGNGLTAINERAVVSPEPTSGLSRGRTMVSS